jgi:prolyl oligopeptidase
MAYFPKPPDAKRVAVEETLHGRTIRDPYRWLEDADSSETQQFVREQLAYARSVLDTLPERDEIHQRLTELLSIGSIGTPQVGGDSFFYTRRDGSQNQPVLLARQGVRGQDRILIDPNQLSSDGTVALDWWYPTHDGRYVAYGTSASGSEISTLRVMETVTGKALADTIERTRAASVAWKPDNSGFYYTRYPKPGEVPAGQEVYHRRVYYHALGSAPEIDRLIFAPANPEDWPSVDLSEDGRWLLITVSQGWVKSELYLTDLEKNAAPARVSPEREFIYGGHVFDGEMYVFTNEDAPRYRVMKVSAERPEREHWREIIPQSDAVLQSIAIIGGNLIAQYEHVAISQLKIFRTSGAQVADIALPGIGSVTGLGGTWDRPDLFFGFQSFPVPPSVYHIELPSSQSALWDKVEAPAIDPSRYEVQQVWFSSKDGTQVPMFIFHKTGITLNGRNPTLLTGYGGFNISLTPTFAGDRFLWLDRGGVFAVANLRGGSELGEEWHRAGMLERKQNVFDDFIAAAEYLIAAGHTDKDHLAIRGGSNGGLLMGAMLTQRPDLFRAVVCQVPLLDMLRYQNFQIAKLWIPEYGSADDAAQFEWLYAYSPYHHVAPGTRYPATLFMTGESDTRVDPMHAKKMAALLQAEAANCPERPILLRIEPKAGHGMGKPISKLIDELTDVYAFLFWQTGK